MRLTGRHFLSTMNTLEKYPVRSQELYSAEASRPADLDPLPKGAATVLCLQMSISAHKGILSVLDESCGF